MTRLTSVFGAAFAAFLLARGAGAQLEVADGPVTPKPEQSLTLASDEPFFRFAVDVGGGVAIVERDTVGGFARLGGEFTFVKNPRRSRFVWGMWDAYEGWFAKDAGGFALPIVAYVGFRKAPVLATVGGGLNVFTIDHLEHDTGFGLFSPRAEVRLGVDLDGVVVAAHSDVQYRWLWGRDDISLIQVGLSIGLGPGFQQPPPPPPPRR